MIIEHFLDESHLTESDKSLARYLLDENNNIKELTSSELGRRTYTSQSAVTRLYKKLGFKNYREFISTLIIEKHDYYKHKNINDKHPAQYFTTLKDTQSVISSLYQQTITQTNFLLDQNTLNRICNRITSASSIDIYGIGISDTLAKQMAFKLQSIGILCTYHSGLNEMYIKNMNDTSNNVSIFISLTGKNDTVRSILQLLKKKKIYTFAIMPKFNDFEGLCRDSLMFDMSIFKDIESMCSIFAAEYIINIVFATLAYRRQITRFLTTYEEE